MIYTENDYGSYESPNSIILGMVNEAVICNSPNGYNDGGAGNYGDDDTNDNGDY